MLSFLTWIPLLGPIIQGFSSIIKNFTTLDAVKLQTAAQTTIAETNASVQIIQATHDDIGLRFMRDLAILPTVVWMFAMGWDTVIGQHWHWLFFGTPNYPASVQYIPYAVIAFLFGNIGINMWSRR